MSEDEAESAADDFEKAARKGLDPDKSESLVKDKIKKGKKDKELSDAVAEKSEKRLKRKDKQDRGNKEKKEKSKGNRKK